MHCKPDILYTIVFILLELIQDRNRQDPFGVMKLNSVLSIISPTIASLLRILQEYQLILLIGITGQESVICKLNMNRFIMFHCINNNNKKNNDNDNNILYLMLHLTGLF